MTKQAIGVWYPQEKLVSDVSDCPAGTELVPILNKNFWEGEKCYGLSSYAKALPYFKNAAQEHLLR